LFGNLNVATGEIVAPKFNATRTEEDFAENIDAIVATDLMRVRRWNMKHNAKSKFAKV